jgi:hypothetical protein
MWEQTLEAWVGYVLENSGPEDSALEGSEQDPRAWEQEQTPEARVVSAL